MAKEHEKAKKAMGGSEEKHKGSKVSHMEIHRADGGGFIVHHHHEAEKSKEGHMEHKPMTRHVVNDADDLGDHVQQTMGDQPAAGEAPDPDDQPAGDPGQSAAAPAPAAGMMGQ